MGCPWRMKSLSRSQPGISSLEAIKGQKGWCLQDGSFIAAELLVVKSGTVDDDGLVASLTIVGVERSCAFRTEAALLMDIDSVLLLRRWKSTIESAPPRKGAELVDQSDVLYQEVANQSLLLPPTVPRRVSSDVKRGSYAPWK